MDLHIIQIFGAKKKQEGKEEEPQGRRKKEKSRQTTILSIKFPFIFGFLRIVLYFCIVKPDYE